MSFRCFVSFLTLDGRYQQDIPQLSVPDLLVAVSERHPAHFATPQPPDWLSSRKVLPGKVMHLWVYSFTHSFHPAGQQIPTFKLNRLQVNSKASLFSPHHSYVLLKWSLVVFKPCLSNKKLWIYFYSCRIQCILLLLFLVISFAAKDEDRTSCGSSTEALPALPSGLYHRNHLQLLGQGKVRQSFVCHT